MLHLTQLVFVHPGKEAGLIAFEAAVIPLMAEHGGRMLYRIRPDREAFIDPEGEVPYEVHVITFPGEEDLQRFLSDERRGALLHMKAEAVRSTLLIKGRLV